MTQPVALLDEPPTDAMLRLSVEQYDAMVSAGILGADARVELLEGLLVTKMTKRPPHRIATRRTRVALEGVVPVGWYVDTQEPIVTSDSEPEPDVAVVRGRTEDYTDSNPGAEHVGLVVEVADATLLSDRKRKARIYAKAGIPTYWLVDLARRVLAVHTGPTAGGYVQVVELTDDDSVSVTLAAVEVGRVDVRALMP